MVGAAGLPLDPETRGRFGPLLGRSLNDVRLSVSDAPGTLGAEAFTIGRHITVSRESQRKPANYRLGLLGHELIHTIHQENTAGQAAHPRFNADRALEREADVGARALLQGRRPTVAGRIFGQPAIQRRVLGQAEGEAATSDVEPDDSDATVVQTSDEAAAQSQTRQETLDALSEMDLHAARWRVIATAYQAQRTNDIALAEAIARRLLDLWIESDEVPGTLSEHFGPGDAVDILINQAASAFDGGHLPLAGLYLSIATVQLVRAANSAVSNRVNRAAFEEAGIGSLADMGLPLQRHREQEVLQRFERIEQLMGERGAQVREEGSARDLERFERMGEDVATARRQAGPQVAEDLGTGGVAEPATPEPAPRRSGGRGRSGGGGRGPAPQAEEAVTPPARPEPTEERPVSRAAEEVVNSAHSDLEGALVIYTVEGPPQYGNVRSPRYGVNGTLAGAHRQALELFGRRSSVIVEDSLAMDGDARQIRYLVLALDTHINPPNPTLGEGGQVVGFTNLVMLGQPPARRYFNIMVVAGDWQLFPPAMLNYISSVRSSEAGIEAEPADAETRRAAVFGPIDALIAAGDTQEAANQLTFIGAQGFALASTEEKIRYLAVMLDAFTFEQHELTIVQLFRTISSRSELRAIIHALHERGLLRQLRTDLESAFPSLAIAIGRNIGGGRVSRSQAQAIMREIGILRVAPGIEVRADGTVEFGTNFGAEFRAMFEELWNTISGAVTGIIDILMDPGAFAEGIGKLLYFMAMWNLAQQGHPGAMRYVGTILAGIARELSAGLAGLAALQEAMPEGEEFIRELQRSVKWRIVWEVVGLFVGVGEVIAFVDAVRAGRATAAIGEMANAANRARQAAEAAELAQDTAAAAQRAERSLGDAAASAERALDEAGGAERALDEAAGGAERALDEAAEGAIASRDIANGARLRRTADGRRLLCINPCAELDHLSLGDDVIDAAVGNLPADQVDDLVDTLAAFKGRDDIPTVEGLVSDLARGGEQAAEASELLGRVNRLRQIENFTFDITEVTAAYRRGDAVLDHGPLQVPEFLEDIPWGSSGPAGPWEIHGGHLHFRNRPALSEHGLPQSLRQIDFVILEGEGGVHRLILGRHHSGLSGGRPFVFGAGELRLNRSGEIISINRMSGHYQPSPGNLERVAAFLRERGVLSPRGVFVDTRIP